MTTANFFELISHPEKTDASHAADLKELVRAYPYFSQARLLWLQSLKKADSIHTGAQLAVTSLYVRDKRWLYYFLYPEMKLSQEQVPTLRLPTSTGSYFDMLDAAEAAGGDSHLTLRKIAEQLKESRARMNDSLPATEEPKTVVAKDVPRVVIPVIDYFKQGNTENEAVLEEKAKLLIRDRKYMEAIEILKQLNLINPKKSIYFADQIRFLEKIIVNSYKTR